MGKPKIRFEGYSEDWEQRKLGDITVKIGSGKTPSGGKSAYVETGIPLIRSQNVNGDKVDFADIVFVDETTDESMANSRVYTNDVLLNITGASIGRSAVYKGLESANVNQHVCIIRPTEGYQPDFIQLNLSSDNGQKQIDASQAGGGREGLNFQEIGKMQFCFPSLNEQKCIGRYFNSLDHFITLHQRKCDETKTLKKYMLQKMFPQNGEKVPEIRFDGFTEDWEQRKLGDLIEDNIIIEQSDGNHGELYPRSDEFTDAGIPYIAASAISSSGDDIDFNLVKYLPLKRAEQFRKGVAQNGDILLAHNATVGPCLQLSMEYDFAILSTSLTLFRINENKMNSKFFLQMLRSDLFQNQLFKYMKQTTRSQVPILTQRKLEVCYPNNTQDQELIGTYLSNLDHLITLHQRKCDELRSVKKFMLQNMFI